jgi:hypothetical protein
LEEHDVRLEQPLERNARLPRKVADPGIRPFEVEEHYLVRSDQDRAEEAGVVALGSADANPLIELTHVVLVHVGPEALRHETLGDRAHRKRA